MTRIFVCLILLFWPGIATAGRWQRAESANFVVYGEVRESNLRSFTGELERFDQLLRAVTGITAPNPRKLTIFLAQDDLRVRHLIGMRGTAVAGVYVSHIEGPYAIVPRRTGGSGVWSLEGLEVLRHEYVHHFMLQHAPAAYPLWYREGFAEFYSTAKFKDEQTAVIGAPVVSRVAVLRGYQWAPYANVLSFGTKGISIYPELLYSQGWLLLHAMSSDRALAKQVNAYLVKVSEGTTTADAYDAVFGPKSTVLDEKMKAYVARSTLPGIEVLLREVRTSPITLSRLSSAEDALIHLSIRLRRDLTPETAADLARSVRRNAAQFGNDPFALELLARAALKEGGAAEALQAAERLIAIRPASATGMLVKGSALVQMAAAKKDPRDPLWRESRRWLVKANDLQRDDPSILFAYYRSFEEQGAMPPADATEALVQAYRLYPQNSALRLAAARELHRVKRDSEALAVLKPLANDPHSDGEKNGVNALLKELQERSGSSAAR